MESDSSETNLVIITKKDRFLLFCKIYWRILIIIITPFALLPITYIKNNIAYKSFYIFLITVVYWVTDAMHPSIVALVPIALMTIVDTVENEAITQVYIRNGVLDCFGILIIITAIEYSLVHRRIAIKLLLLFDCSHYRLSFLLFFISMLLSMWISNIVACGLMMPIVKAVLIELEKMGILEIYQTIGKSRQKSRRHELSNPRPTDFTIFYFMGIAYSASIGGMATIVGSETNQILKIYCETIFPNGPKIEFPHFMLINLPGVLLMETMLYMWMNFYFLGMFRAHSDIALEIGMTEEETRYITTLLATQYEKLGRIKFHEAVVGVVVVLNVILEVLTSITYLGKPGYPVLHSYRMLSSPSIVCVVILFITPINLDFVRFFRNRRGDNEPLPTTSSKACLNWNMIRNNINWSVLIIIGGSCTIFETLKDSNMTDEFEQFLLLFSGWPAPALVLVVIVFCKLFAETASSYCVAYCILPHIARLSIISNVHPHYLMLAATLACSVPFHLITGTPVNAMVSAYVHIPPWKMMYAGFGPSIIAICITWFTVTVWAKAIWTDLNLDPKWAEKSIFKEI